MRSVSGTRTGVERRMAAREDETEPVVLDRAPRAGPPGSPSARIAAASLSGRRDSAAAGPTPCAGRAAATLPGSREPAVGHCTTAAAHASWTCPRRPRRRRRGETRWPPPAQWSRKTGSRSRVSAARSRSADGSRSRPPTCGWRGWRQPFHGLVEVGALEQKIPPDLLLDLGERTVGEQRLTVAQRHRGGGAGRRRAPLSRYTPASVMARAAVKSGASAGTKSSPGRPDTGTSPFTSPPPAPAADNR